jgi:protein-S-isoprenylcysteine O-methyltransferase Ste14
MYLGFHALTLAAVLVTGSLFVLLPGLYSVVVYHLIILGEERYLQSAFGPEFERYRRHVRRYL